MSNFLKTAALTSTLVFMSIAGAFAQNKADIKLSDALKPTDPKYKTTITQDNGKIDAKSSYISNDGKTMVSLHTVGTDINGDGILEASEITEISYNENLRGENLTQSFTAVAMDIKSGQNITAEEVSIMSVVGKESTVKDNPSTYNGISDMPYVTKILPGLKGL